MSGGHSAGRDDGEVEGTLAAAVAASAGRAGLWISVLHHTSNHVHNNHHGISRSGGFLGD